MSGKYLLAYDAFIECVNILKRGNLENTYCIPSHYLATFLNRADNDPILMEIELNTIRKSFIIIETLPMADIDYTKLSGIVTLIAENQDFFIVCIRNSTNFRARNFRVESERIKYLSDLE